MSKAGIIAGKFLQGAAPVLQSGAEAEQRADLQKERDDRTATVQAARDKKLNEYKQGAASKVADAAVVKGDADRASSEQIAANRLAASNVRHQQSLDAAQTTRTTNVRPPDDIAKANWLMTNVPSKEGGGQMSHDEAWSMVQAAKKTNPTKFVEDYVIQAMKNHDDLAGDFDPNNALSEAQSIFDMIGGTTRTGGAGRGAGAGGDGEYKSATEIRDAVDDGLITREEAHEAYRVLTEGQQQAE